MIRQHDKRPTGSSFGLAEMPQPGQRQRKMASTAGRYAVLRYCANITIIQAEVVSQTLARTLDKAWQKTLSRVSKKLSSNPFREARSTLPSRRWVRPARKPLV